MRIEVAGALAVGKSTLCKKLELHGFHVVYEDLSANPYLELRKQDPEKYGFLAQQSFVDEKLKAIKAAVDAGFPRVVVDFCMAIEMAYAEYYVSDRPEWLARLERQVEQGLRDFGQPDLIVHLHCPPELQLARIKARGRGFEQGHDLEFVRTISGMVRERVDLAESMGVEVVHVDSSALNDPYRIPSVLLSSITESIFPERLIA